MQPIISLIVIQALAATMLVFAVTAGAQWPGHQWQPQQIDNPYCSAPTYVVAYEPRNAGIQMGPDGYIITVSRNLSGNPPLLRNDKTGQRQNRTKPDRQNRQTKPDRHDVGVFLPEFVRFSYFHAWDRRLR